MYMGVCVCLCIYIYIYIYIHTYTIYIYIYIGPSAGKPSGRSYPSVALLHTFLLASDTKFQPFLPLHILWTDVAPRRKIRLASVQIKQPQNKSSQSALLQKVAQAECFRVCIASLVPMTLHPTRTYNPAAISVTRY